MHALRHGVWQSVCEELGIDESAFVSMAAVLAADDAQWRQDGSDASGTGDRSRNPARDRSRSPARDRSRSPARERTTADAASSGLLDDLVSVIRTSGRKIAAPGRYIYAFYDTRVFTKLAVPDATSFKGGQSYHRFIGLSEVP